MSRTNFYCQNVSGDAEFSIDQWNSAFEMCIDLNLSEKETSDILDPPPPCKEQCFACMAIVGERQKKTRLTN